MIFAIGGGLVFALILAVNYSLVLRSQRDSARMQAALYSDLNLTPPTESVE